MKARKLSIIIPVFNEAATVQLILEKIHAVQLVQNIEKEYIIVDDGSKDNSKNSVHHFIKTHPEANVVFIQHAKNSGKGASIRTGISKATGEYLIIQDADMEYDPNEYNMLLQPILDNVADVVYGSRFLNAHAERKSYFWHSQANKLLTFLSNQFSRFQLTDMETCYKLFKTEIIQNIHISEERFGFEPEITAKLSRIKNIRVYEVAISYYGRMYSEGKKIGWKDGVRAIYCIVKYGMLNRS